MPNHVMNRVTGPESLIDRMVATKDGKKFVDFNLIIPQPELIAKGGDGVSMHVELASQIALGLIDFSAVKKEPRDGDELISQLKISNAARQLAIGPHPKDFNDKDWDNFMLYLRCYRECDGLMNWYSWNTAKWGTKWNAYNTERVSSTVIKFETAWSAPHPVMQELAKKTKLPFLHEWADEDTGSNVGYVKYQHGEEHRSEEFSGTKEGYELAFDLRPDHREDYELVDGEYKWKDSE